MIKQFSFFPKCIYEVKSLQLTFIHFALNVDCVVIPVPFYCMYLRHFVCLDKAKVVYLSFVSMGNDSNRAKMKY